MTEGKQPPSLNELDAKIKAARANSQRKNKGKNAVGDGTAANSQGISFAFRLGTELVASLVVGVGFGMLLDYWLDTKPWFLIVFFLLGAGSGISSVYRAASGIDMSIGYSNNGKENSIDEQKKSRKED